MTGHKLEGPGEFEGLPFPKDKTFFLRWVHVITKENKYIINYNSLQPYYLQLFQ